MAAFRSPSGGQKPVHMGLKVCYGTDEAAARRTAHRLWSVLVLPSQLPLVLPTPELVEQASSLVSEDVVAEAFPCGPDLGRHVQKIQEFADAGVDELCIQQIGGAHEEFFRAYEREVLPRFH